MHVQRTHTYTNNECTSVCKYVRTVCMYSIYVSCVCSEGPGQGIWMDIHVIIIIKNCTYIIQCMFIRVVNVLYKNNTAHV